jgi:glycosyltransferase involved in cell wall biosynthesis
VAQLRKSHPELRVRIIGGGPFSDQLKRLAAELKLEDAVELAGDKGDIPAELRNVSHFVLPSRTEALPVVLIEALAAGTVVIATRVGIVPEVIKDGVNGFIAEPDDPQSLVVAIERAIKLSPKEGNRIQISGVQTSLQYRPGTYASAIEQLYDAVLSGQPVPRSGDRY